MVSLKRSRSAVVSDLPAPSSKILFIALHEDSYVPEFLDTAQTSVLKRSSLPKHLIGPWQRVVQWTLDGFTIDSFGAGAVMLALKHLAPEKVYISVEEGPVMSFSARVKRSFWEVGTALLELCGISSWHVYLCFPPTAKHAPSREVLNELSSYFPVSGYLDGDVGSIVFQARAAWMSSKRLEDAEKAVEKALEESVRSAKSLYKELGGSQELPKLLSASVEKTNPVRSHRQKVVWAGSLSIEKKVYIGFELVDMQSSGSGANTMRFSPGSHAKVVAKDDWRVVLGAFAFSAPSFEIRPCPSSEMVDDRNQPVLHSCASLLVALREAKQNLLLSIGNCFFFCSWRRVRLPMSLQYSWILVAAKAPTLETMDSSILDVATFRRKTLGLEGRSSIYSAKPFLRTLPVINVHTDASGKPVLRIRDKIPEDHGIDGRDAEAALQLMSLGQPVASEKKKEALKSEVASIRRLCTRRSSSASAPERRVLRQWDEDREVKRKRAEAKGVDDASLVGSLPPQSANRALRHFLSPAAGKQQEKVAENDPAAAALRSRRSMFCTGVKGGVISKVLTVPKQKNRPRPSTQRARPRGPRSLPTGLFAGPSSGRAPEYLSFMALRPDRIRDSMSLSTFLENLAPFEKLHCIDRSQVSRPNGFSVGLSAKALQWEELVVSRLPAFVDEGWNFDNVAKAHEHGDHGVDPCDDSGSGFDPIEGTVLDLEKKALAAEAERKSYFSVVSKCERSKNKLRDALNVLFQTTCAPTSRPRQYLSSEGVADALADLVVRNEQHLFTCFHMEWLPDKIHENVLRFHLPEKLLMSKRHSVTDFALELLKGRPDCDVSVKDGLFHAIEELLEDVRDGEISLAPGRCVRDGEISLAPGRCS